MSKNVKRIVLALIIVIIGIVVFPKQVRFEELTENVKFNSVCYPSSLHNGQDCYSLDNKKISSEIMKVSLVKTVKKDIILEVSSLNEHPNNCLLSGSIDDKYIYSMNIYPNGYVQIMNIIPGDESSLKYEYYQVKGDSVLYDLIIENYAK